MARRKTDQERAAESAIRWRDNRREELRHAREVVKMLEEELERSERACEMLAPQNAVADAPPADPPPDELATSGLPEATIGKLRALGLTTQAAIFKLAIPDNDGGDYTCLADLGPAESRIGPKEVAAIRKWVEGA